MYSIASLIDSEKENCWSEIEKSCKYSGIVPYNAPHFSWQTADSYQLSEVRQKISSIVNEIRPFEFSTSGLGIFNNDRKIIFLIVVKNKKLLEIHELLWNTLIPFAINPKFQYAPDNWIPHISINIRNIDEKQFSCSLDELLNMKLDFIFHVNEIGILSLKESIPGIDSKFKLSGNG
jgi:2'-5' RNA ligase